MMWEFDYQFDEDEFFAEVFSLRNLPVVGPWIGYVAGDYLPSFSEESLAATVVQSAAIAALGLSARLGAAAFIAGRRVVPIAAGIGIVHQTISDPSDNPVTRAWQASPTSFLFGDHYWQQYGVRQGTNVALSNVAKNFGF